MTIDYSPLVLFTGKGNPHQELIVGERSIQDYKVSTNDLV